MTSEQQWLGRTLLHFQLFSPLEKPLLRFRAVPLLPRYPLGIPSQRVGLCHSIQKIRLASPCQTTKRSIANLIALFIKLTGFQVFTHQRYHLVAHLITIDRVHVETAEKTLGWRNTPFLVSTR